MERRGMLSEDAPAEVASRPRRRSGASLIAVRDSLAVKAHHRVCAGSGDLSKLDMTHQLDTICWINPWDDLLFDPTEWFNEPEEHVRAHDCCTL